MNPELIAKKKKIVEHYLKQKILLSRDVLMKLQHEEHIVQMYAEINGFGRDSVNVNQGDVMSATSSSGHVSRDDTYSDQTSEKSETVESSAVSSPIVSPISNEPSDSTLTSASTTVPTSQKTDQTPIDKSRWNVEVKKEWFTEKTNYTVQDWVGHFTTRFRKIESMLKQRSELSNLTSIRRLTEKNEREQVSIIGMVYDKGETKNGNISFTIEDLSGTIKVICSQKSKDFDTARDTQLDEIIGIQGSLGNNVIFANRILYPDIPRMTEIKKAPDEVYACVPSDMQIGSKLFLPDRFEKFIQWTRGEYGTEQQREIARKTAYILIPGDIVEGVGIFPGQEEELEIKDVTKQYEELAKYLRRVPSDKHIIICTGNHDAGRIAEPQPRLYPEYAQSLYDIPNCHIVTNPATVTIHKSEDFPGFDCLFYHGFSYVYYCDNVQSIKDSGLPISDRTGIIMQWLLKRRHLAPTYASTRVLPNPYEDCLVIEEIPDFFLSGHIHKAIVTGHRGVSIIVGSCFMSTSAYQEKFGHVAIPGQVPLINLKTRKVTMLEF